MAVKKQRDQRPPVDKEKIHGYCHYCHKFGHKAADFRFRGENQRMKREQDTNAEHGEGQVNSTPPEKVWMKELEASKESKLSVINEVSVVDVENNEVIDKNDTHHEGNILSDVEEYIDKDEGDEEGCSDDCGILF